MMRGEGFDRRRGAQRHAQVLLDPAIVAAKQVKIKRGSHLDRGTQVRHAAALAIAAHRRGQVETQIDLEPILIEQGAAHAVAVRLQELAVINDVRYRQGVGMRGIRAPIILEGDCTGAETEFPQGRFFCVGQRGGACGRQQRGKSPGLTDRRPSTTQTGSLTARRRATFDHGNLGHNIFAWGCDPME